jgi:hypothetical protein
VDCAKRIKYIYLTHCGYKLVCFNVLVVLYITEVTIKDQLRIFEIKIFKAFSVKTFTLDSDLISVGEKVLSPYFFIKYPVVAFYMWICSRF